MPRLPFWQAMFVQQRSASVAKPDELVVITKTYDLILWSCQRTSRFPRQHRFVLGERMERTLYDLQSIR